MHITVVSPLFPPDTGAPAPYVKSLIKNLSADNLVTLICLGYLPESVDKVNFLTIDKRKNKLGVILMTINQLFKVRKETDIYLINNSPVTELAALICSFFVKNPFLLCISDKIALKATDKGFYKYIHSIFKKRIIGIISLPNEDLTYLTPEILPFDKIDNNVNEQQSDWWKEHIKNIISYVRK